jgi:hypothetical protein
VHLRTGWEPDTPLGDTLLRRSVFNLVSTLQAPVVAMGGRTLHRDDVAAADLGRPAALYNSAVLLQPLDPQRADAVLGAIEEFFAGAGTGEVLLWSPWPTPDLHPRGWQLEGHPPLLIRPAAPPPAAPPRPPVLRIEPVADAGQLHDFERVIVDGFPFEDLRPLTPGALYDERMLGDPRNRLYLGYDGEGPVAAAVLFVDCGVSHLALATTLPRGRRQGHWQALARHRLQEEPGLPAIGIFSDMSRPGAEAIGFLPITRFTLWHRGRR